MGILGYLLDAHIWIWWQTDYARIPSPVRRKIGRPNVTLCLSAATAFEIGTKHAQGKLRLPMSPADFLDGIIHDGARELPITRAHAIRAAALPNHHRDPFDRILIAQAQLEALHLVTADPRILAYDVMAIDARR